MNSVSKLTKLWALTASQKKEVDDMKSKLVVFEMQIEDYKDFISSKET